MFIYVLCTFLLGLAFIVAYSGKNILFRCIISKYLFPFCRLSFHVLKNVLWYIHVFNWGEIQFIFLFILLLVSYLRNHCLNKYYKDLHLCFFLCFIILVLNLCLFIFKLFLYMELGVQIHYFACDYLVDPILFVEDYSSFIEHCCHK